MTLMLHKPNQEALRAAGALEVCSAIAATEDSGHTLQHRCRWGLPPLVSHSSPLPSLLHRSSLTPASRVHHSCMSA
jgi:hypothetical protein